MAKVTLEFDSIEDSEDLKCALYGWKYAFVIDELDQYYRSIYKYSEIGSEIENAEKVRDKIREIMYQNGLTMD
jgi:hypothetical protein